LVLPVLLALLEQLVLSVLLALLARLALPVLRAPLDQLVLLVLRALLAQLVLPALLALLEQLVLPVPLVLWVPRALQGLYLLQISLPLCLLTTPQPLLRVRMYSFHKMGRIAAQQSRE
jgi:hypothetical protein